MCVCVCCLREHIVIVSDCVLCGKAENGFMDHSLQNTHTHTLSKTVATLTTWKADLDITVKA